MVYGLVSLSSFFEITLEHDDPSSVFFVPTDQDEAQAASPTQRNWASGSMV